MTATDAGVIPDKGKRTKSGTYVTHRRLHSLGDGRAAGPDVPAAADNLGRGSGHLARRPSPTASVAGAVTYDASPPSPATAGRAGAGQPPRRPRPALTMASGPTSPGRWQRTRTWPGG